MGRPVLEMEEYLTVVEEVSEGMELTKQLRTHLNSSTSSVKAQQLFLLEKILSSYDKALLLLNWQQVQPDSSISMDGSPPRSEVFDNKDYSKDRREVSKKRKLEPKWSDQVRVSSENGLEGPVEDGYSWRKYGQKDILGAKYPRSYYRCAYHHIHSCWATKQVQRSDSDPSVFDLTYRGKHTCQSSINGGVASSLSPPPPPPRPSPPNKDKPKKLRVNTQDLINNEEKPSPFTYPSTSLVGDSLLGDFSPSFMSESNYFLESWCLTNSSIGGVHSLLQGSESDFNNDRISANTSPANSPILDLDFSRPHSKFPFGIPGFFN